MLPSADMWLITCLCSAAFDRRHLAWQQNRRHKDGSSASCCQCLHTCAAWHKLTVNTQKMYSSKILHKEHAK